MTVLYNRTKERYKRRVLRHKMTESEKLLWFYLRNEKLGWKFRRQFSIDYYIVDFYCPQKKLVIELDGTSHDNAITRENDEEREKVLAESGMRIIRFRNHDVIENITEVLNKIRQALNTPSLPSPY